MANTEVKKSWVTPSFNIEDLTATERASKTLSALSEITIAYHT